MSECAGNEKENGMMKFFSRKMGLAFVLLVFVLTGCGGGGGSSSSDEPAQEPPAQVDNPDDNNDPVEEEEEPVSEPGTPEDFPIVKSLTVSDEHLVSVDSFLGSFSAPFIGLSDSGEALAVWVTSNIDFQGGWNSTLHTMAGDISSKSWAEEKQLPLPKVGAVKMDMGGNGDAVIALSDDAGVTVFHYTVAGGLGAPMRLKSLDSTAVVGLDVNDHGDAVIVWEEFNTNHLVSRFYDKDAQNWGSEVVLNVATNGDIYSTQGHAKVSLNNSGQALFVDSAVQSGQTREAVIARRYNGSKWSELNGDEASAFPYASADSVSAFLDDDGRIVVGMGRGAPAGVYISGGTIFEGLNEATLAFYNYSNQSLFQLDARWTGENQITASFVDRESVSSKHYVSYSEDSGATWKVAGFFNETYGNDSAKSSTSGNTIYIQDGSQCQTATKYRAPLIALNPDMTVTKTCVINRMTSVDIAVNDAGQGVVMGKHDAIDSLLFHFFESNY